MNSIVIRNLVDVLKAVAPLIFAVSVLQFTVVHAPLGLFLQFLFGSVLAIAGMLLLFIGIDIGVLPMGRFIGAELPRRGSLTLILAVAFAIGFAVTVAEPDVLVLATQVDEASAGRIPQLGVLYVTGFGVAVMTAIALARIVFGWPMKYLICGVYVVAIALALIAPADFVPLAFDAGSVTTGVLTAPVVISLTLGLTAVLAGRDSVADGFGVMGLASIGAVVAVLAMGVLW
jgi:hypothetical protein